MLKTVSSITNAIGALNYVGTWNASTNTPTITSSVGTKGDYYQVSVAGSTSINGISNWGVGDVIAFNGSTWQRIEGGADGNFVNLSATGQASSGTATPASGVVHTFQESASLSAAQRLLNRNSTQIWHVAIDAAAVDDGLYALINVNTGQVIYTLAPSGNATVKLGDMVIGTAAKGVVMTNAAGTVTKRVRLNDAGNGLIFQ